MRHNINNLCYNQCFLDFFVNDIIMMLICNDNDTNALCSFTQSKVFDNFTCSLHCTL